MHVGTLAKFVSDTLITANWPKVKLDEKKQTVKIPGGTVLEIKNGRYRLNFYWYSFDDKLYSQRERYSVIVFPRDFNIRNFIFFRRNGSYKLSHEQQFKNILNPLGKHIREIRVNPKYKGLKFHKDILVLPITIFLQAMRDAEYVYKKSNSYRGSTENYLSNLKSQDYSKDVRKRTTYLERGEFNFLVDRLYIKSKKTKKDFLKYLDDKDIKAIELFLTELLRLNVLSDDFLRRLDDYFIKERLRDIIDLGRNILSLRTTNLKTSRATDILKKMDTPETRQLESIWQRYFEKNLLYLIFTYKKIFPKIELKNIEGDKKYPDFIGINHYNGLDVIEIKTHLKYALMWDGSHGNFYFSPEMSKAIVQTTNYMDAIVQARFQNAEDKTKITQLTDEENLYHPRGIIVISSQARLSTKKGENEKLKRDFTKLRNSLHNIEILTFDEIINIADEYIKNIVPAASEE